MAWPDAVSIVRELGIRESSESGPVALLGAANHTAPYPSRCTKTRHYETNWLAHLSSHLFHTSSIYGCSAEDYAGAAASLDDSRDATWSVVIDQLLDTCTQAVTTEKRNAQEA